MVQDCKNYSRNIYNIDPEELKKLKKLNVKKSIFDLIVLLITIILILKISVLSLSINYLFIIPLVFLIAGRQGVIMQFMHECSHYLMFNYRNYNVFLGKILGLLIGLDFTEYKNVHRLHHGNAGTIHEPITDKEKYLEVNTKTKKLYLLFLNDILGISAIKNFLNYSKASSNEKNLNTKFIYKSFLKKILSLCLMQLILLVFIFEINIINYLIFWIYPLMGPHMLLMRIRGIAEHGLHRQKGLNYVSKSEGAFYTRSFLTNSNKYKINFFTLFEKALIGTLSVNYHHEHHLDTKIPYYNLKKFHNMNKNKIINIVGEDVYEKGYFSAVFKQIKA